MVNDSLHLPVPNSVCSYDPIFQVIWNKDLKPCLAGVHWCKPVLGIPAAVTITIPSLLLLERIIQVAPSNVSSVE